MMNCMMMLPVKYCNVSRELTALLGLPQLYEVG